MAASIALLALCIVCIAVLRSACAQTVVVPHDPLSRCEALNSTICSDLGAEEGKQISLLEALGFTSCAKSLKEFACVGNFPPCVRTDTQSPAGIVATPALPCYNSCKAAEALCIPVFAQIGLSFPACPPEQIVYDCSAEGGGSVVANCTAFGDSQTPVQEGCPLSVVFWGDKFAHTMRTLIIVFGYIGLVACILVVALTASNSKTMKWPGPLLLVLGFGQVMVAFGNTISSWVSVEDLHCNPEARYVNICRAQGFFIVFGSHVIISTWLVITCITSWCVWSENPANSLRLSRRYWWVIAAYSVVPLSFTIYCCFHLGGISASLLCITNRADVEEHGLVLPLLVQVCIGTLLWLLSIVGAIRTFGLSGSSGMGKRQYKIYARLLLYEMIAIIPSALLTFPVEVYRDKVIGYDSTHNPSPAWIHGGLKRIVIMASVASFIAPLVFGIIFLIRPEHYYLIRARFRSYTGSAQSNSGRNSVRGHSSEQRAEL